MPIKLIVGLGNPGPEYEDTRHNAGFWLLDQLAQQWHSHWQDDRKFFGHLIRSTRPSGEIRLLKPQTYMNLSGQAVQAVASFYKIQPQEILVIHDELDLEPGRIKFKLGGGNGGHNGLKDIQAKLGTPDFYRLRLGIGHPGERTLVIGHVLNKPSAAERELIDRSIEKALAAMPLIMAEDREAIPRFLHSK